MIKGYNNQEIYGGVVVTLPAYEAEGPEFETRRSHSSR